MKFLADAMVGRLARWLRFLGIDTAYEPSGDPHRLLDLARREGRTVLTRNTLFLKMKTDVPVCVLDTEKTPLQVRRVVDRFGLRDELRPFTRCAECNTALERVSKEEARGKVPFYTFRTKDRFARCPACGRFYWAGEHASRIDAHIREILGGS